MPRLLCSTNSEYRYCPIRRQRGSQMKASESGLVTSSNGSGIRWTGNCEAVNIGCHLRQDTPHTLRRLRRAKFQKPFANDLGCPCVV